MTDLLLILAAWLLASFLVGFAVAQFIEAGRARPKA